MAENSYNEISSSARINLVSNRYMHSQTFNFRNAVAAGMKGSTFHRDDSYKLNLIKNLEKLKREMVDKENLFYDYFNIQKGSIEHRAKEFNLLLKQSLENYKALEKLNSPNFYNFLDEQLDEQILDVANFLEIKLAKSFEENTSDKTLRAQIYNAISEQLKYGIDINFEGKTKRVRSSLKKVYSVNKLDLTEAFLRDLKTIYNRDRKKNEQELNKMNSIYYENNLKNKVINYLKKYTNDSNFLQLVKNACEEVFPDYGISLKQSSNTIGAIGEMSNVVSFDAFVEYINKNLGRIRYIGGEQSGNFNKKPPIDFLIDKFGIQAKNSKAFEEDFADIHVKTAVLMENFVNELAARLGEDTANQYSYLVTNILWLRKKGLDSDGNPNLLKTEDIPMIMSFITDILSQAADIYLAKRDFRDVTEKDYNSYGNVFYIYQNKYLIPLSEMMQGIINAVELDRQNEAFNEGIGYFSGQGISYETSKRKKYEFLTLNLNNGGGINEFSFLNKKREAASLLEEDSTKILNYPENIMAIGRDGGKEYRSTMKLKLSYKLSLKNLKKMQDLYGLW